MALVKIDVLVTQAPDGTAVTQWVTDDTLPGGPRTVDRAYTAPFRPC